MPPYVARAWIWATCPDSRYRDGKQAVESATRACELTGWKSPDELDTLAAAYAESGDFTAAAKWGQQAAEAYTDEEHRARCHERLAALPGQEAVSSGAVTRARFPAGSAAAW